MLCAQYLCSTCTVSMAQFSRIDVNSAVQSAERYISTDHCISALLCNHARDRLDTCTFRAEIDALQKLAANSCRVMKHD